MRYLIPAALLFVAACAPRPAPETTPPEPTTPTPASTGGHVHSTLNGMTASELVEHFGRPHLQIREGDGTKLQFTGPNCILDAYLYPSSSGAGVPRVSHIDTRNMQGTDVNTPNCIASLEGR